MNNILYKLKRKTKGGFYVFLQLPMECILKCRVKLRFTEIATKVISGETLNTQNTVNFRTTSIMVEQNKL